MDDECMEKQLDSRFSLSKAPDNLKDDLSAVCISSQTPDASEGVLKYELSCLRTTLDSEPHSERWLKMCMAVQENNWATAFSIWSTPDASVVVDVQVIIADSEETVPNGYEILKSVSGADGDINKKTGGKIIHLCACRAPYRPPTAAASSEANQVPSLSPITALSVVCDDQYQEAPLGFTNIERTVLGQSADLSLGNGAQKMYLCYIRGTGPPINNLVLLFNSRKESTPQGYHKLMKTANDDTADLSSLCKTGNEVFLCFSLDLQFLIKRFKMDISVDEKWSAHAALFVACLFSPSENVVVQSLKSLRELLLMPSGLNDLLGGNLLNIIFNALCDCQILARSHFTRSVQSLGLQVLLDSFLKYVYELRLETALRVYETLFFERHKDRRDALSSQIAEFLFSEHANQEKLCLNLTVNESSASYKLDFEVKKWISVDLLKPLLETIDLHKSCLRVINWFQRSKEVNLSFRVTISDLLQSLCPRKPVDRLIIGLLLTACKIASHHSLSKQPSKSESIMRKIHALTLIIRIIRHPSTVEIMTPKGPLLILRRFVCASLLECYITVVPAVFKLVLSWFTELWQSYRHLLKTELGIIMESVVLGLMQSAYCWPEQKIDLIEAVSLLFPTPGSLVDLFYNYDNDIQRRNLFGRLIRSLCFVCDGQANPAVIKGTKSKQVQQHPVHAAFLQSAYEANASVINLQRTALSTVVTFLEHLAEFVSPPGVSLDEIKATGSRSSSICLPMLENVVPIPPKPFGKQSSFGSIFANLDSSPTAHKRSQSWCEIEADEKQREATSRDRRIRSSTWVSRHMQQKKAQLLHAEAIALARSESIKAAVAMLISRRGTFDPEEIAVFLSTNANSLDKSEIGEFIATDFTRHMTSEQFDQLRKSFMAMIDFTSLDLDSALRHFLVHSGFRLPGEAQKVDRLIQAFADAYVRDNPGVFTNEESVYLVAFALIMLNTDMHDPRLRTGKHPRAPMTKAQFVRNLQGVESTMSVGLLGSLFDGIAARPIEWRNPSAEDSSSVAQITVPADTEKNFLKDCTNLSRQGLAWIKTGSIRPRMYLSTDSKHIIKGMFEVIFPTLLLSLSTFAEKSNESDIEIKTTCIDGIKYASVIALATNSQQELEAFMGILAKVTYVEQHRSTVPGPQIRKALVAGEHLNQNWVADLKVLLASRSKKAVNVIVRTANRLKKKIIFERDQAVLLNIQNEFTDELLLVDPERTFVREGHLTKMSSGSRLQLYRFFLFTDLILYAREQFQKLKLHKVVHLSMCRLMDLPDSENENGPNIKNAFKIISPQKNFTVLAPSQNDKVAWMADIQKYIELCYVLHMKWIEVARCAPEQDHTHSVSEQKEESLDANDSVDGSAASAASNHSGSGSNTNTSRLMSNFIGRPKGKLLQRGCRFCIRDFTMLRRKCICSWCSQTVCSTCSTHRLELPVDSVDSRSPKKLQRVCDACYGHLIGSIEIGKPPEIMSANK